MSNNIPVNGWPQLKDLEAVQPTLDRLDKIEAWKRTVKEETFTGEEITIPNALALPARSLITEIEPIQDLHGYDKPWVGGAGKNFVDYSASHSSSIGESYEYNSYTGWIKESYASGWQHQLVLSVPNVDKLKGQQVTISVASVQTSSDRMSDWRIFLLTYINGGSESIVTTLTSSQLSSTITINQNIDEMRILLRMSQENSSSLVSGDNVVFNKLQLELGSTVTSYRPYSNICPISGRSSVVLTRSDGDEISEDFTIQLGQTVYGADINWDTGVMTVTHTIVDLGTLDWIWSGVVFYTEVSGAKVPTSGLADILCDRYENTPYTDLYLNHVIGITLHTNGYLYVYDPNYSDATSFKAAMNGAQLCYELATPIELTLTPTEVQMLKGYNRVTLSDGYGTIELKALTGANWS